MLLSDKTCAEAWLDDGERHLRSLGPGHDDIRYIEVRVNGKAVCGRHLGNQAA